MGGETRVDKNRLPPAACDRLPHTCLGRLSFSLSFHLSPAQLAPQLGSLRPQPRRRGGQQAAPHRPACRGWVGRDGGQGGGQGRGRQRGGWAGAARHGSAGPKRWKWARGGRSMAQRCVGQHGECNPGRARALGGGRRRGRPSHKKKKKHLARSERASAALSSLYFSLCSASAAARRSAPLRPPPAVLTWVW